MCSYTDMHIECMKCFSWQKALIWIYHIVFFLLLTLLFCWHCLIFPQTLYVYKNDHYCKSTNFFLFHFSLLLTSLKPNMQKILKWACTFDGDKIHIFTTKYVNISYFLFYGLYKNKYVLLLFANLYSSHMNRPRRFLMNNCYTAKMTLAAY